MRTGRNALQSTGFFVLRTPALPFSTLTEWSAGVAPGADRDVLRERLEAVVRRPEVRTAIRVASPDLAAAVDQPRPGDAKAQGALVRYVSRMAGRPTPFGLFAGSSTGVIADRTDLRLPGRDTWRSYTRIDADHLDAVTRALSGSPELRDRVALRPNPSLQRAGGRWRYVEARLDGDERSHHLVEVADSAHLERVLERARDGARTPELIAAVAAGGIDPPAAERYVRELVDAQVLVGELDVTLTGAPPLEALIADLERLGSGAAATLASVRDALHAIDAAGVATPAERHDEVAARLAGLPAPVPAHRLFQVDLVKPAPATLAEEDARAIARAVDLLHRLTPDPPPGELAAFREAFAERYEGREIPLLEALDDELGVGYGRTADPSPLLKGLGPATSSVVQLPAGDREAHLLALLQRAWTAGAHEIALTGPDVEALTVGDRAPLPDALCAIAMLARTADGPRILIGAVGGPSGARLLGRFCHGDPELATAVRAHLRAEEALDPDAIFAEVVHLPTGRMVNILARPVLREWELEWLGRSGAPAERRLPAADLLVSVRRGRCVLRSRRLGRRVVPRLTSAHNWSRRSPGVYRFLCAVQADGRGGAGWSWGAFERAPFLPRLRRGRIVLARARWHVPAAELHELGAGGFAAARTWREVRRLPRWVLLADGDNALPVDLDNALAVEAFARLVRARDSVTLEELFPGPEELVAEGPDGAYAHEILLPLVRAAALPANRVPRRGDEDVGAPLPAPNGRAPATVRRTFAPGSEWATLKLYTGTVTADRVLRDEVAPLARRLVEAGAADAWFFLRYADPGTHLRVRLHGDPGRMRADVFPELEALSAGLMNDGRAHDAVFATYHREIERYGGPDGIGPAERVFHADSDAVAEVLALLERGETGLDERWRVGLLGTDVLLRDLGLDAAARARVAAAGREAFAAEFAAGPAVRRALGQRFRAERGALEELLGAGPDSGHPLAPGAAVLARRSERLAPVAARLRALEEAGRLTLPVEDMADSFVHMWLNRLMRADNRAHEYAIYDLLARLYAARAARARA